MKIQHERLNKTLENASTKLNQILGVMRTSFIAGVLILVPLIVTVYTMFMLFQITDGLLGNALAKLFAYRIPGLGLILTAIICIVVGMVAKNLIGRRILSAIEYYLDKIPVVRSLYNGVKQVADVFMKKNQSNFKRVVILEYPKEHSWVMGFVTADFYIGVNSDELNKNEMVTVFVPTTPNPTSGFLLIVEKSRIVDVDIDIEEAMKVIISGGLVQPHTNPFRKDKDPVPETENKSENKSEINTRGAHE